MFTGLIETTGRVRAVQGSAGGLRLDIGTSGLATAELVLGESIAVSGVCLTVVARDRQRFAVEVSDTTLACTTLGGWQVGCAVNLERALCLGDRLGGHLLSGHVDGVGQVLAIDAVGDGQRWRFALPEALARYVAVKGSIAVDGVSLTVNAATDTWFEVNLIPHTLTHTVFALGKIADPVNLEVDQIARYVERLRQFPDRADAPAGAQEPPG
ncbi:MAG: riboflavin synthase [Lysobacterales bacterium]